MKKIPIEELLNLNVSTVGDILQRRTWNNL
jgi:hypothetical protein